MAESPAPSTVAPASHLSSLPGAASQPLSRNGLLATAGAFLLWGLLPLYLRPLRAVAALEVMAHRVLWCCVLVLAWLALRGGLRDVARALATPKTCRRLLVCALLVSCNWVGFVWAVSVGRVLDASLGYFINPLVNVLLGVLVLSERLTPLRWTAVATATAGVLWLSIAAGDVPWIALMLALSFSTYGLIRKVIHVEAVVGLAAETSMLAPFALAYLVWTAMQGSSATSSGDPFMIGWLLLGGLVTAVPLALFAYGARQIPYSTVGLIQYLAPTLHFACGVLVFGEPFSRTRLFGFALIWVALALYALEGMLLKKAV